MILKTIDSVCEYNLQRERPGVDMSITIVMF